MAIFFEQRVGVFVDVQNMFYAAKHLYNSKLNFSRLLESIARDRPLTRAIAYVVQTPEIDQSNFLAMLRSNGYEIRAKDLKQRPDGSAKGDWDMGLALDALSMVDRLDVVAIVSGDGDFVELVNYLKARGVRVEVYSFPYSTAEELRHSATEYFQMGTEMVINPQPRIPNGYPTREMTSREANSRESNGREYYSRDSYVPELVGADYHSSDDYEDSENGRHGANGHSSHNGSGSRGSSYDD